MRHVIKRHALGTFTVSMTGLCHTGWGRMEGCSWSPQASYHPIYMQSTTSHANYT